MVEPVKEFLDKWEVEAIKYYKRTRDSYLEERAAIDEAKEAFCKKYPGFRFQSMYNEVKFDNKKQNDEYIEITNRFFSLEDNKPSIFNKVSPFYDYFDKALKEALKKEVANKYASLVKRIEKIAGEIKDAKRLMVVNGDLNGIVVGSKDTVSVRTITAGGYNIQCLHYRVLVKKYK